MASLSPRNCAQPLKEIAMQGTRNANVGTNRTPIYPLEYNHEESSSYSGGFTLWRVATVKVQWQEALMMIKGQQLQKFINNAWGICLCICWLVFRAPVALALLLKITPGFLYCYFALYLCSTFCLSHVASLCDALYVINFSSGEPLISNIWCER